jgi:hypothetical protein
MTRVGDRAVGKLGCSFMVVRVFSGESVGGVKGVVGVVGLSEATLAYTGVARKVRRERLVISLGNEWWVRRIGVCRWRPLRRCLESSEVISCLTGSKRF